MFGQVVGKPKYATIDSITPLAQKTCIGSGLVTLPQNGFLAGAYGCAQPQERATAASSTFIVYQLEGFFKLFFVLFTS